MEGDTEFNYQPKVQSHKIKKKLQSKYHGSCQVYKPSSTYMGYVRAEVNYWDPLENESYEEELDEENMPSRIFDSLSSETQV